MGLGAIVLGGFALMCMIGGILLTVVPFLGTMLSFLSPVLALAGIVLGGVAYSRAKDGRGESEGLAVAGLVTSIFAFIPGMLVALTCGLCNTCVTGMYLDPSIGRQPDAGPPRDANVPLYAPVNPSVPPPLPPSPPPSSIPSLPVPPPSSVAPSIPPPSAPLPEAPPSSEVAPMPTPEMPPPPLPPGPTQSMRPRGHTTL